MGCSGNEAKGVVGQPFAKETRNVTHGFNQLSQQNPGIEMQAVMQERYVQDSLVYWLGLL